MTDTSPLLASSVTTDLSPAQRILLSAAVEKRPREPFRFRVTKARVETPDAGVVAINGEPGDFPADDYDLSEPARAVLEAKAGTCRFPFGAGSSFRYCAEPASVVAAGRFTYCAACAERMYTPKTMPTHKQAPVRSAAQRKFLGQ